MNKPMGEEWNENRPALGGSDSMTGMNEWRRNNDNEREIRLWG